MKKTSLKLLATNTHGNFNKIHSKEDVRPGHLNLKEVESGSIINTDTL